MTQTCLVSSIRPEPVVANLTSVVSLKAQNEKGPFKCVFWFTSEEFFGRVLCQNFSGTLYSLLKGLLDSLCSFVYKAKTR